jgi:hypothetical protein
VIPITANGKAGTPAGHPLGGAASALVVLFVTLTVSLCNQRQVRREAELKEAYGAIIKYLADTSLSLS